jgi:hypothetical protein
VPGLLLRLSHNRFYIRHAPPVSGVSPTELLSK